MRVAAGRPERADNACFLAVSVPVLKKGLRGLADGFKRRAIRE